MNIWFILSLLPKVERFMNLFDLSFIDIALSNEKKNVKNISDFSNDYQVVQIFLSF